MRNIVLVHGAWADGSGWRGVYENLVRDGFKVSIVQEPETSFEEDVAATKRVLAQQDRPCILVAHSYGGAVVTEAGTDPSVVGLVYVAAHMPDAGENEVVAAKDRIINPDLERWYAKRAHSHTIEVAGASHTVYVRIPRRSQTQLRVQHVRSPSRFDSTRNPGA